ncbi:MAG TPA: hypothetical protein VHS09_02255 [Polyangiaceae bacterium]|nr:hypothetical protein [Polyangiaceae bacterium]
MGESVLLVAEGGPPDVEFALFDPGDIELHATEPGTIREIGYRTTVGEARRRLAEAGYTPAFAAEVTAAVKPAVAKAYARSTAARCVVDRLEGVELLESRAFDAETGVYAGTWLDFGALAADLGVPRALAMLRATYLAVELAALPEAEQVFLATSELSAVRRPGERTFRRVTLGDSKALLAALTALQPMRGRGQDAPDTGPSRREAVLWLRERARQAPEARERLHAAELVLGSRDAPPRGPLAETALWNVEAKLARGETSGAVELIDAIEQRRGRVPGSIYLRARIALMTRAEDPGAIAKRVSELSTSMAAFHELQLLAAQAWLAAGDARRARAFARDLVENTGADDVLRMQAHELLEAAGESSAAHVPPATPVQVSPPREARAPASPPREAAVPAVAPQLVVSVTPGLSYRGSDAPTPRSPEVQSQPEVTIPRPPLAPSGTESPIAVSVPAPSAPRTSTRPGFPAAPPTRPSSAMRTLPPGTTLPPYRVEPRGERTWSMPPPHDSEVERVETLSLPAGMRGESPPLDEHPRTGPAARLTCTFLARELGREIRARYAVEIRSDVDGLEAAQRYLREEFVDGRVRTPDELREVMRQGGFLSELLARRLGARWVDLESPEPGRWAMLVPSRTRTDEVARVWPFARVLRFVAMGHKERDLVSYYLELEGRAR